MKYEIIENENGNKRVLFEDVTEYAVNVDSDGKEYFAVPNIYTEHPFRLFNNRIKDAIQTIREGNGDVLSLSGIFGPSESVYKYVDRTHGEEMRAKTIEGFKDTVFGFSLKFGYTNSFNGSRFISKKQEILSVFEDQNEFIYFGTEEEAENMKDELLDKSKKIANEYARIKSIGEQGEIAQFVETNYNTNIISELWTAIAEPSESNAWKLEVVQVIKPQ